MRSLPSSRRVLSYTTTQWPLLKRRQPQSPPPTSPASAQPPPPASPPPSSSSSPSPSSSGDGDGDGDGDGGGVGGSPPASASASASASSTPSRKDARVMLILQGLSPSLNASDFHRLAPSSLSCWQHAIKKVQQLRDPLTLAPLGRYHISFAHAVAAIAYRDNLLRLHKLARHRHAHSGDVLWESTVPAHLRSWTGTTTQQEQQQQSPAAAELEGFTVTMGLGDAVDVQRRRVPATRNGWARRLRDLVVAARVRGRPPHGENAAEAEAEADAAPLPPVVLVVAYPPTLTAGHLRRAIREDGLRHGLPWKVFPPEPLLQPQPQPQQSDSAAAPSTESFSDDNHDDTSGDLASEDSATSGTSHVPEKLKGRFVVACADESEARRFHRHWNGKTLTAGLEGGALRRNVLDASIINW